MRCTRQNKTKKKILRGFTFIEILIVTMMMSVVSLAIYSAFNNGIKIWQRLNRQLPQEDINIFFDKFASDLRNCVKLKNMNFIGKADMLEFSSIVMSARMEQVSVGKFLYRYDRSAGTLRRDQFDYSAIFTDEKNAYAGGLEHIKSLKFLYYNFDEEKNEYNWQEEWLFDELPKAVRVEIEFFQGPEVFYLTSSVGIPISE
ncbi:MAG: prepilin-type N-terminal cleavage/methylation domain-containing protein [Candidatus Omnitrophota bacterium]|jgi:prepilin-type N-terminal cleavage/methylation domain-containing protein